MRAFVYSLAGAAGTLLHWLVYGGLLNVGVGAVASTCCGAVAGALLNYVSNYRWVFASRNVHRYSLPRFLAVALLGMSINAVIVALLQRYGVWLAQFCATFAVLLIGYQLNARWTFGPGDGHTKVESGTGNQP